jgi:SAM-dependent methyltransferase
MGEELWNAPSHVRHLLGRELAGPSYLRVALNSIPKTERDSWWDRVLFGEHPSFDLLPADCDDLPQGSTPYLPCPLDAVLAAAESLALSCDDILVDIGAGTGRAAALLHFLTGATTVGIEIQKHLFDQAVHLMREFFPKSDRPLNGRVRSTSEFDFNSKDSRPHSPKTHLPMIHGDAIELLPQLRSATAYFLYCPFGGSVLTAFLAALETQAHDRRIRISCVDMPRLRVPWLQPISAHHPSVHTYESVPP